MTSVVASHLTSGAADQPLDKPPPPLQTAGKRNHETVGTAPSGLCTFTGALTYQVEMIHELNGDLRKGEKKLHLNVFDEVRRTADFLFSLLAVETESR